VLAIAAADLARWFPDWWYLVVLPAAFVVIGFVVVLVGCDDLPATETGRTSVPDTMTSRWTNVVSVGILVALVWLGVALADARFGGRWSGVAIGVGLLFVVMVVATLVRLGEPRFTRTVRRWCVVVAATYVALVLLCLMSFGTWGAVWWLVLAGLMVGALWVATNLVGKGTLRVGSLLVVLVGAGALLVLGGEQLDRESTVDAGLAAQTAALAAGASGASACDGQTTRECIAGRLERAVADAEEAEALAQERVEMLVGLDDEAEDLRIAHQAVDRASTDDDLAEALDRAAELLSDASLAMRRADVQPAAEVRVAIEVVATDRPPLAGLDRQPILEQIGRAEDAFATFLADERAAAGAAQDAAEEVTSAAKDARSTFEDEGPAPTELVDILEAGADAVAADVAPSAAGYTPELGLWGLLVIGVASVLIYRRFELVNNESYGAPVVIAELTADDGKAAAHLAASIASRWGSTELAAPPDTPGGNSFTSVVTTLTGTDQLTTPVLKALGSLATNVAFPLAGVSLSGSVVGIPVPAGDAEADAGAGGGGSKTPKPTRPKASVMLAARQDERFLRSETFDAEDEDRLADTIACFVAADVYAFSEWTPEWGRDWGRAGESLRTYRQHVRSVGSDDRGAERLTALRAALVAAPANGLLRLLLAFEHELAGQRADALRLNLHNRLDYPHFLQGRTRVASALALLADSEALRRQWWGPAHRSTRHEIARLLLESGRITVGERDRLVEGIRADEDWVQHLLLRAAIAEASAVRWRLRPPVLLATGLWARSHRRTTFVALSNRAAEAAYLRTLQLVLDQRRHNLRGDARPSAPKMSRHTRRGASASVLYNGACFWALRAAGVGAPVRWHGEDDPSSPDDEDDYAVAIKHCIVCLERSLRAPTGSRPFLDWIRNDPDLDALHGSTEGRAFIDRLEEILGEDDG
jgi:hypothetical protein